MTHGASTRGLLLRDVLGAYPDFSERMSQVASTGVRLKTVTHMHSRNYFSLYLYKVRKFTNILHRCVSFLINVRYTYTGE